MSNNSIRTILPIETIFLTLFFLIFAQFTTTEHRCLVIPGNQFAFWQAANAFTAGINPYDAEQGSHLINQRDSRDYGIPEVVWSPPVFHPLSSWYADFSYPEFLTANLLLCLALTLLSFLVLSIRYDLYRNPTLLIFSRVLILTSLPVYLMLICAPALPIGLLGLSLFLFFSKGKALGNNLLAGIFLGFATVKPHSVLYLFILILIWSFRQKSFRTLLGMTLTNLVLLAIALWKQPEILSYYLKALPTFPHSYLTPTINRMLIEMSGLPVKYLIYYGLIPMTCFAIYLWRTKLSDDDYLIRLAILLSIIFAPYLWSYEFIILSPLAFHLLSATEARNQRIYFYLFLLGNFLLLITGLLYHMGYHVFYPLCVAAGFLITTWLWPLYKKNCYPLN